MSSYTAQTLISQAFTQLGILEQGGTPNTSDSTAALALLNNLVGQWHIQDRFVWGYVSNTYALTGAQNTYPIGPTAAVPFNVPRPTFIEKASLQISTGPIVPLKIITLEQYRGITDLTATAAYPQVLYYDRASPIGNLILWPTPTGTPNLILETWDQLGSFANLSTAIDLPDGYVEPFVHALAVRCMPMFGVAVQAQVAELVSQLALQAEAMLADLNSRGRTLMMTPPTAAAPPPPGAPKGQ